MMDTSKKSVISVRNLTMGWPGKILLENVSFDIYEKQIVFIMGGSGCGKSTLMKTIIGLNPPMAGDILIRGKSIINSGKEIPEIQRSLGIVRFSNCFGKRPFPVGSIFKTTLRSQKPNCTNASERYGDARFGQLNSRGTFRRHDQESRHSQSPVSRSNYSSIRRTKRRT